MRNIYWNNTIQINDSFYFYQDIGDGWWEGTVNGGNPGLFPYGYVEVRFLHIYVSCQRHFLMLIIFWSINKH